MKDHDRLSLKESIDINGVNLAKKLSFSKGFKTCISAYDDFGNVIFEKEENQTVLGGALFALAKIFDVNLNWSVATLNSILGIANTGDALTEEDLKNTYVCLFGAGIGGSGDIPGTVKTVKFQQRELNQMIPFRITDQELPESTKEKYWMRQKLDDGYTAYYLKTLDAKTCKALWLDGVDGEEGSAIPPNVFQSNRTEPIECFAEMTLRIDTKDFREYFNLNGDVNDAKINTIGLFTGIKKRLADGTYDYKNVKLFSAFNFTDERFQLEKGMNITYKVYIV